MFDNDHHFSKILQAVTASIIFHGLFSAGVLFAPSSPLDTAPVEIEFVSENEPLKQQRKQNPVDESEEKEPPLDKQLAQRAQLLSKFNKRVKEQSIAKNKDIVTQNQFGKPLDFKPDLKPRPKQNRKSKSGPSDNPKPLELPGSQVPLRVSTAAHEIPGVKQGSFTALNTDQFTYYSFFERANQAIRFRWVRRVRQFVENADPRVINQLAKNPKPTVLRVLLDHEGMVVNIVVSASSGSNDLDQAIVKAFYAASPLNHPPDGLIDEDRLVRLDYAFIVHFQRQSVPTL